MNKAYLLQDEYEALLKKKEELQNQMNEIGELIGEVTSQTSETYHDNAGYDEWVRLMKLLCARNTEINKILNVAHIFSPIAMVTDVIGIASVVTVELNGEMKDIVIGWYLTLPGRVAYHSALWKALMGRRCGESVEYEVGKQKNTAKILKLSYR